MFSRCAPTQCVFSRTALACALASALVGCQSLTQRGPVSKEVQSCRQLSSQGMAAIERGEWQKAEELLSSAIKSCPVDTEARRRYAEALWHRGDAAAAMGQLEEAARISPERPELAIRMGEIYLALDHWDNARRAADQALAVDCRNAAAWSLRARAAQGAGDLRQAMADFQRALGYQPNDPVVLQEVAELYRRMGQPERALTTLQRLIDSYPPGEEPPRALHLQGLALHALSRHDAAIESYNLAIHRNGTSPDLLCHLAEAEFAVGRPAEAQRTVEKALAIAPGHRAGQTLAERMRLVESASPDRIRR
jgi:tetratricopeptide (TPR) repeat protein